MNVNFLGWDRTALTEYMSDLGEPSYRTDQILKWIHQRNVTDFNEMSDLSKQLRSRLSENASIKGLRAVSDIVSRDGTRKWLLELDDGNCVETVFIPEGSRGTLCISSQVGCSLTCSFCATGRQGFNRNLTTAEIIAQVWFAINELSTDQIKRPITNIVLMGMGEPLLNFEQVVPALRLMLDDCSYGFSKRKVTLSTAGVIPGIKRLLTDCPVSLAVSLHAPDDELRNQLVPINRKYPIADLMAACAEYARHDRRCRVTFEYIMIKDVNDSPRHAKNLVCLLSDIPSKVNLIPYNSVAGLDYERSSKESIDRFRDVLLASDVMTITRKTRGDEVAAACGQLVGRFKDRTKRSIRLGTALPDPVLAE